MRNTRRALLHALCVLPLAGCVLADAHDAAEGRTDIVGLTKNELRMCAGFPTATANEGGEEIWTYVRSSASGSSLTLPTLPAMVAIPGPSFSQNSTNDCRAQMRFRGERVVEVAYAGSTDVMGAQDAACGDVVQGCIDYAADGTKPAGQPAPPAPATVPASPETSNR